MSNDYTIKTNFSKIPDQVYEELIPAMGDGAELVADEMRRLVPVGAGGKKPGRLRDSIGSGVHREEHLVRGYVYAGRQGDKTAKYAADVEYGTRNMAAQPFLRPAAETFSMARVLARMAVGK